MQGSSPPSQEPSMGGLAALSEAGGFVDGEKRPVFPPLLL